MAVPSRMLVASAMTASGVKPSMPSTSKDQASVYPSCSASRATSVSSVRAKPSIGTDRDQRFCIGRFSSFEVVARGSVPRFIGLAARHGEASLRFGSSRVHGLREALPRDPSVADVAAVQEEQVRRGAPVGQALDLGAALRDVGRLATLLLPLVEGLGTGTYVRERGLENPRPWSWIVHLAPEHPCAVGRRRLRDRKSVV